MTVPTNHLFGRLMQVQNYRHLLLPIAEEGTLHEKRFQENPGSLTPGRVGEVPQTRRGYWGEKTTDLETSTVLRPCFARAP